MKIVNVTSLKVALENLNEAAGQWTATCMKEFHDSRAVPDQLVKLCLRISEADKELKRKELKDAFGIFVLKDETKCKHGCGQPANPCTHCGDPICYDCAKASTNHAHYDEPICKECKEKEA